jgi:hypothetical protein
MLSPFPFHYSRRSHVPDASLVVSSSSDMPSSSDDITPPLPARHRHPPDRYSPSHYVLSVALEPISYRDAERHPKWQLAMAEEFVALERTGTWHLSLLLPVFVPSHVSGSTRLRLAPMDLLSTTKRVLWLVVRGSQQEQGHDYDETIALVAHMTTLSLIAWFSVFGALFMA